MRESRDLSKISIFELFSDLKTFEFDIDRRKDEETSNSKVTTLVAADSNATVDSGVKKYSEDKRVARAERRRKQDKEMVGALLTELDKSKEVSPSSSKPVVESKDEESIDSENNEELICLMARVDEVQSSYVLSLKVIVPVI
ncbi:hypothetical protein ACS0TY_034858 [Phlomoides rotata]